MPEDIGAQLVGLLKEAAGSTFDRFTTEDKTDLAQYGFAVAQLVVQRRSASTPTQIADIDRQIKNYKTAVSLMADRYLFRTQDEASKAAMTGLKLLAARLFDLLIAAVV
ncbi:MAG TPA: hypothetical protein VNO55_07165 [Polyangia bacterium]|nr:hypothetical protein [Polyangia bacterium]